MKIYFTIFALWITLALLTGLYDLQISQILYNPGSTWAMYLQNYGMLPGLVVLIFASNIFYLKLIDEISIVSYLRRIFVFLTLSFFYFYFIATVIHLFYDENFLLREIFLITALVSFAISFISLITLHFIKYKPGEKFFSFSKVCLALGGIGYLILIQATKTLWGRIRYRELDFNNLNFTDWYLPQGTTGFDSFPSGHAARHKVRGSRSGRTGIVFRAVRPRCVRFHRHCRKHRETVFPRG